MPLSSTPTSADTRPGGARPRTDASDGTEQGQLVTRPEPGLARGRWEAPAWVFVAVALAVVVGGLAWAGRAAARWRLR